MPSKCRIAPSLACVYRIYTGKFKLNTCCSKCSQEQWYKISTKYRYDFTCTDLFQPFWIGNAPNSDRKDLLSELELMKKLKPHPHVIKLMGCVTETGKIK